MVKMNTTLKQYKKNKNVNKYSKKNRNKKNKKTKRQKKYYKRKQNSRKMKGGQVCLLDGNAACLKLVATVGGIEKNIVIDNNTEIEVVDGKDNVAVENTEIVDSGKVDSGNPTVLNILKWKENANNNNALENKVELTKASPDNNPTWNSLANINNNKPAEDNVNIVSDENGISTIDSSEITPVNNDNKEVTSSPKKENLWKKVEPPPPPPRPTFGESGNNNLPQAQGKAATDIKNVSTENPYSDIDPKILEKYPPISVSKDDTHLSNNKNVDDNNKPKRRKSLTNINDLSNLKDFENTVKNPEVKKPQVKELFPDNTNNSPKPQVKIKDNVQQQQIPEDNDDNNVYNFTDYPDAESEEDPDAKGIKDENKSTVLREDEETKKRKDFDSTFVKNGGTNVRLRSRKMKTKKRKSHRTRKVKNIRRKIRK